MDLFSLMLAKQIAGSGGISKTPSEINFISKTELEITYTDGTIDEAVVTYDENDNITAITIGEVSLGLSYDSDGNLTKCGVIDIVDIDNIPSSVSLLDNTVIFKAEVQPNIIETYSIVSVKGTQTIAEPNPHPTSSLGNFAGWYIGEDRATFPLEVNTDIEINALFKDAKVEIEWNEAGTWYAYAPQVYTEKKKTGTGFCLAGHIVYSNNYRYGVLVSDNADSITVGSSPATLTLEYDGNTYYYQTMSSSGSAFRSITNKSIDLSSYIQTTSQKDIAIKLLDYYFNRV